MNRWVLALALMTAASNGALAQFYAPKTDYHDPVQRLFVVEAARVLAWWTDSAGTKISEITYDLTVKPDRSILWSIRCWSPAHEPIKEAVVSYSPDVLKSGPEFYRSVFKQLWQSQWKPVPALEGTEAATRFWRGAARCGLVREENLLNAAKLVTSLDKKPGPAGSEWMPELAGLLAHTTLASLGESVTLDQVVLARAAAWLALTEQASSTKSDALWAPILFQAGRYQTAGKVWLLAELPEKPTPQQEGWNVWLRNPTSKDIFRFAATLTNFTMAMPMLAWDAKVNGTGPALVALLEELAGGRARLQSLHNYAAFFAEETTVKGGTYLEGLWPLYARMAWLRLLGSYPARTNEYRAYLGPLRTATNALVGPAMAQRDIDNSLKGLSDAFPLLHLAQQEGVGKLVPTAVATTRDLLNYGWETTGWQLGARYAVLRSVAQDVAERIHETVFPELEGLIPFFRSYPHARRTSDYYVYFNRLECVEGLTGLVGFSPPSREGNEKEGEAGPRLARRSWLRHADFQWLARALWDDGAVDELGAMMNEFQQQGGALAAANILHYLSELNEEEFQKLPRGKETQLKLGESLPEPSLTQADAFFDSKFKGLDHFARAQAYERMFWENPDSGLERSVIFNYIISGSFKAAKRFYTQARVYFTDPVRVSNYAGRQIYLMAWCQDDVPLRKQALKDSECGSRADLTLRIWDAAMAGDTNRMEKAALEFARRYEPAAGEFGMGSRLVNFLPLLPGLRAKSDPLREDALDYWEGDPRWLLAGFIWIDKYKLENQDAERMLGSEPEGSFRGMALRGFEGENIFRDFLLSYLKKNQAKALQDFNELMTAGNVRTEEVVLAACLYNRLEPLAPPHEEPDLKPPEVTSLKQVVQDRKRGKTQKPASAP